MFSTYTMDMYLICNQIVLCNLVVETKTIFMYNTSNIDIVM